MPDTATRTTRPRSGSTAAARRAELSDFSQRSESTMDRRMFIGRVAGVLVAIAFDAAAQPRERIYRLGILEAVPAARNVANLDALRNGLRDLGYVEGRNLVIEYRSADGHAERFPELAAELVRRHVDLIVTRGTPAARAAKQATETIPVVMATMGDPHALVSSFARPGGNVTGVTTFSTELTGKRIELLKDLVPGLARIALLHNMGNPAAPPEWEETKVAARALGLGAELLDVRSEDALQRVLDLAARRVDALIVGADGLTQMHQQAIVDLIARHRLPATYPARDFVEAGGLMAYAVSYPDLYYRFAGFIDRIFKGARPAELPVERPAKFKLVINLKTAKALGITIPQSFLLRTDEVIQ
jgi:putative ABC transport system substrate-binding protein